MDARTAATEALSYVSGLEGLSKGYRENGGFRKSGNVAIEGAHLTEGNMWEISIGFQRPWDKPLRTGAAMLLVSDGGARTIKKVSIDNAGGNVVNYEPL